MCVFLCVQNGELMLLGINVYFVLVHDVYYDEGEYFWSKKKWYIKRIGKGRFRMFPDNDQSATLEQKKCNVTNCRCCWLKIIVLFIYLYSEVALYTCLLLFLIILSIWWWRGSLTLVHVLFCLYPKNFINTRVPSHIYTDICTKQNNFIIFKIQFAKKKKVFPWKFISWKTNS